MGIEDGTVVGALHQRALERGSRHPGVDGGDGRRPPANRVCRRGRSVAGTSTGCSEETARRGGAPIAPRRRRRSHRRGGQPGGRGGIGRCAAGVGRRVRPRGQGADLTDPHLAVGERSDTIDGLTRTSFARGLRLEERQRPLGTVGGPHGQHPPVILTQRQGAPGSRSILETAPSLVRETSRRPLAHGDRKLALAAQNRTSTIGSPRARSTRYDVVRATIRCPPPGVGCPASRPPQGPGAVAGGRRATRRSSAGIRGSLPAQPLRRGVWSRFPPTYGRPARRHCSGVMLWALRNDLMK